MSDDQAGRDDECGRWPRDVLGNVTLETESRIIVIDAYLAAAVLVGLLLIAIAAVDWWWADPLAGLVVCCAVRESGEALAEVRG